MRCDIVLVTYNQLDYTRACIASIEANTAYPHTVIVVDNNSDQDTLAYLRELASARRITLIENARNEGWVKGVNKGIYSSDAEYVCVMNNDTVVYPGWLNEMVRVAQKDETIGMVNPEWQVPKRFPFGRAAYFNTVIRLNAGRFIETDWARGFCFLVTRRLIQRIGALDLEFSPGYYDDWDYSLRAIKSGFKVARALGSFVWHFKNITYSATTASRQELNTLIGQKGALFHERWGFPLRVLIAGEHPWERAALKNLVTELLRDQHRVAFVNGSRRTGISHANFVEVPVVPLFRLTESFLILLDDVRHREKKRFDLIVCSKRMKECLEKVAWIKNQYRMFEASGPDNSHVLLKTVRNLKHEKKTL